MGFALDGKVTRSGATRFFVSASVVALAALLPMTASAQTAPDPVAAPESAAPAPAQTDQTAVAEVREADQADNASGDIVVTAQRRSENAQRVPVSLTALPAVALAKAGVTNVLQFARVVPSFSIFRASQVANTSLRIRGLGSSGNAAIEPSVGAFIDGVYIPRPGSLLGSLNDIASVEVLRGPQGTLFGRNASVGAISFHTAEPENQWGAKAQLELGNYGRVRTTDVLNAPITDDVAARLAVLYDRFDGYGYNDLNGDRLGDARTFSVRGSVKAELTPTLHWLVRGDYQQIHGDGEGPISVVASTVTPAQATIFRTRLNGLVPVLNDTYNYHLRTVSGGRLRDNQGGLSSDLSLSLGDYTLRLISAARIWNNRQQEADFSLTPADIYGRDTQFRSNSHSEELQLISPANNRLSFVGGLYYFRENYQINTVNNLGTGYCNIFIRNSVPARLAACLAGPQRDAADSRFVQVTDSLAAYGQATFKILDTWDITGGLRYSHDLKNATIFSVNKNSAAASFSAPDNAALRFSGGKLTYRVATTYRPTQDVMFFGTVSTGYKSGGFDSSTGATLGVNRSFRPETVTNYEVGWKTQFFDRRLTFNNTFFRMDVDDFQIRAYNGTTFTVFNAGSIRQKGTEFEVNGRPLEGLTLAVAGTRLFSKYTSFKTAPGLPAFGGVQDMTGKRAAYSPKWQGNASIDYQESIVDGLKLGFNSQLAFVTESDVGTNGDGNPQTLQSGYALLGARVRLTTKDDKYEIAVQGENLTAKGYCTLIYSQTFSAALGLNDRSNGGTVQRCVLGEPRTVRVVGTVRF